jgi:hypothetical protein
MKFKKTLLLAIMSLILLVSTVMAFDMPLTLAGQKAGCSVYPANTFDYPNGGAIDLFQSDSMFNLYRVEPTGWVFIDEYQYKIKDTFSTNNHYVVEQYDGCDFGLLLNPWDNGVPDFFEDCPSGYIDDNRGNCVPTEKTRLSILEDDCESKGKYWYLDECHAEPMGRNDLVEAIKIDFSKNATFIIGLLLGFLVTKLLRFW